MISRFLKQESKIRWSCRHQIQLLFSGSTECEDAFIPECLQEEEVSEPYFCDIVVWNGADISDLGVCEQKWSDIYSDCPDDLVKETCQKTCNFCGNIYWIC